MWLWCISGRNPTCVQFAAGDSSRFRIWNGTCILTQVQTCTLCKGLSYLLQSFFVYYINYKSFTVKPTSWKARLIYISEVTDIKGCRLFCINDYASIANCILAYFLMLLMSRRPPPPPTHPVLLHSTLLYRKSVGHTVQLIGEPCDPHTQDFIHAPWFLVSESLLTKVVLCSALFHVA
jgi:hypothetical protein